MEIRIKFIPEKPKKRPKSPQKHFSAEDVRKIFEENKNFFDNLVKSGYSNEEASIFVLNHCEKNGESKKNNQDCSQTP